MGRPWGRGVHTGGGSGRSCEPTEKKRSVKRLSKAAGKGFKVRGSKSHIFLCSFLNYLGMFSVELGLERL